MIKIKHILLALTLIFTVQSFAKTVEIPEQPKKQALVVDNAGVFSQNEFNHLTQKLNNFNTETSTQILVYTTNDLNGYDVADFAQRLGAKWGVGQKGFDNGIVMVFKPKTGTSPGRITIQTGYGIEPLIPDITANKIIDNEMIPAFKQGNIFAGIDKAVDVCISLTKEEFTAVQYEKSSGAKKYLGIFFFLLILGIFVLPKILAQRSYYNASSNNSNLPFWAALFLLNSSSHRSSGWNDFSSGSGSFGGGGGFGGGGFGGGGASGSW